MKTTTTLLTLLMCASPSLAGTAQSCDDTVRAIPDGDPVGLVIPLNVVAPGALVVSLSVDLAIEHAWVGDLVVELLSPDGNASALILDRPGTVTTGFPGPWGCGGDDIDATFDDHATATVTSACTATGTPVYTGPMRPQEALGVFAGVDADGVWTLLVRDAQGGDAGDFVRACLTIETEAPTTTCVADFDADGDVDLTDFGTFGAAFGSMTGDLNYDAAADFDGDGDVDLTDFGTFGSLFGRTDC